MVRRFVLVLVTLAAAACGRERDIKDVPVGTEVQVTRNDGALVEGRLTEKAPDVVKVDTGPIVRSVPTGEIAEVRPTTGPIPDVPPKATFREIHVAAGTELSVRLLSAVSSESSHAEDPVRAELAAPLIVDRVPVAPEGAAVRGVVSHATPAGRVKGRASVGIRLTALQTEGRTYVLDARVSRTAPATKAKDAKTIGIPAAGGAVVGAIVGGKKGAAVGAAIGGGGGAAVVMSTPGKPVVLERGSVLPVHLEQAIEMRVDLRD